MRLVLLRCSHTFEFHFILFVLRSARFVMQLALNDGRVIVEVIDLLFRASLLKGSHDCNVEVRYVSESW